MTVAELIEKLKEMPQDQEVCILNNISQEAERLVVVNKGTRASTPYFGYLPMKFVLLESRF